MSWGSTWRRRHFISVGRDQAKAAEYQLEELGDVGELVEKVTLKNGKRLVDDIDNYTNLETILGIHTCSRVFACI